MIINKDNTITLSSEECEKLKSLINEKNMETNRHILESLFAFLEENSDEDEINLSSDSCIRCEDKKHRKYIKKLNSYLSLELKMRIIIGDNISEKSKLYSKELKQLFVRFIIVGIICLIMSFMYVPGIKLYYWGMIVAGITLIACFIRLLLPAFCLYSLNKHNKEDYI